MIHTDSTPLRLRFRYDTGTELAYHSHTSITQTADGGPGFSTRHQDDVDIHIRVKVLGHDPEDGGFYTLCYHEPEGHVVNGVASPLPDKRIVYIKQTELGAILESSDPTVTASLLLPEASVSPGDEWRITQEYVPPQRMHPIEVVTQYRVESVEDSLVTLTCTAPELQFGGDTPASEDALFTLSSEGRFVLDRQTGVLQSARIESHMTSKDRDILYEVLSVRTMNLITE